MKRCKDCTYIPCTKEECSIDNQEGCEDYKSTVSATMKLVSVDKLNYKFEEVK